MQPGKQKRERRPAPPIALIVLFAFVCVSWFYVHLRQQLQGVHGSLHTDLPNGGVEALMATDRGATQTLLGRNVGSQMTVAIAGGQLWGWGTQADWRLGLLARDTAAPAPAMGDLSVISSAASRHSLAATAGGRVVSCGDNGTRSHAGGGGSGSGGSAAVEGSGQLGRGGAAQPAAVVAGLKGKSVVQVASGRYHSLAVTSDGELFSWGLNDWGQIGRAGSRDLEGGACTHGAACVAAEPGLVETLAGVNVVAAAAGRYSSMAVDYDGRLYVWGLDGCASNGTRPPQGAAWQPREVQGELLGSKVVAFDLGYVFWIAATADGCVFTCATGDDGYSSAHRRKANAMGELGRGGMPLTPGKVGGALRRQHVLAVAAGRGHALAVAQSGAVYSWGGSEVMTGRPRGRVSEPGRVAALSGARVLLVAAGEYYSLAATETSVYGWGRNTHMCTGVAAAGDEVATPTKVAGPLGGGGMQILGLSAGYKHAFAIAVRAEHGSFAVNGDSDDRALAAQARTGEGEDPAGASGGDPARGTVDAAADFAAQLEATLRQMDGAETGANVGNATAAVAAAGAVLPGTDGSSSSASTEVVRLRA